MANLRHWLLGGMCAFATVQTFAQKQLLPKPQMITMQSGSLKVKSFGVSQSTSSDLASLLEATDLKLKSSGTRIALEIVPSIEGVRTNMEEAYHLKISSDGVTLQATTKKGLYWGLQTLSQLTKEHEGGKLPCMEITDWPSFKVRGFMQDVGRSYVSMEELKREIAMLSKFKINVFHWHLTENQAWRLESKRHPEIVADKNMTRMIGKYYTQEEAKELQAFCKQHNMTLIPEIDMPGHSAAFQRAFGVDMQSEKGMTILKELIDEICQVLDEVPYLHIGTDEVKFTNPKFCDEMVAFIRARGKKVISWNPGWRYKAGEIDMTQMWSYRGKPTPGVPAIDSKFHYLNHFDTFADIYAFYTSKIGNVSEGSDQIAGTIVALWHDRYIANETNMIIENYLYPNMLAIAERAWQGGGWQYYDDFGTNMKEGTPAFQAFCDFESRMLWHKEKQFKGYPFAYVKQTDVKWNITDALPNGGDLTKVFEPETVQKSSYAIDGNNYGVSTAVGSGVYLRHHWGNTIPTFYKDPKENHTAYAWTYVHSPKKQTVGLWFETQNYSRSEMDLAPQQGKWDYRESKLWLNGEEVMPPVWTSTHTQKSNETPLGNENMVGRAPLQVQLNKGWNKVLVKLPIGKFSSPQVRLTKWMFSAAFVTLDGTDRIQGLTYATSVPE
ncbi:MAG: beta-N-acetylhexosaminidase [Bacteroidales bacterium]